MRSNHCLKFESSWLGCIGLVVSIEDQQHSKQKIPWLWQYKRELLQQMHEFPPLYSGSLRYACPSAVLVSLWVVVLLLTQATWLMPVCEGNFFRGILRWPRSV